MEHRDTRLVPPGDSYAVVQCTMRALGEIDRTQNALDVSHEWQPLACDQRMHHARPNHQKRARLGRRVAQDERSTRNNSRSDGISRARRSVGNTTTRGVSVVPSADAHAYVQGHDAALEHFERVDVEFLNFRYD